MSYPVPEAGGICGGICPKFARVKDDQLRDRLLVGILNNNLSEKLQLVKAVDMARNSELVKNQIKDLQSKNLDAVKDNMDLVVSNTVIENCHR